MAQNLGQIADLYEQIGMETSCRLPSTTGDDGDETSNILSRL